MREGHELAATFVFPSLEREYRGSALTLTLHVQGARLYLLPAVREGHELAATFVFPSLEREYRAKAEDYVSHFVGHEGAGSLLSTLKVCACGFVRSPGPLVDTSQRCSCPGCA